MDWGDRTLSEELPLFEDVVIPKTELYLRRRLEDRIDVALEVHLWRRSLVVVKRFKLDFLTRDNIVLFKKEASVLRRLAQLSLRLPASLIVWVQGRLKHGVQLGGVMWRKRG